MTQLTFEPPGDHIYIRSVGDDGIRIGDVHYADALIVGRNRLVDDWPPQSMEALEESHLEPLLDLAPEVVLLGTGHEQKFLSPALQMAFLRRGVGIEVMTTLAACRTFNVLATEGRDVVAALLPVAPGN